MSSLGRDASAVVATANSKEAGASAAGLPRLRLRSLLITAGTVAVAAVLGWQGWRAYMATPWTRDGTVRAYVVSIAPQVAGQIVELGVKDNQFVHEGDLLMRIDPTDYAIVVRQAEAGVEQAKAVAENAQAEWARRQKLNNLAVTLEEQQTYASKSLSADAGYQLALANLANARVNLRRTRIVSPVNGYVTNLLARAGDYANVGQRQVSVINSDSYWVDAYLEETFLGSIHDGDAASVKLMGYSPVLHGHVQGIARGINVPNAAPSASGLASVNPIFAFVRLAQRIPVRVQLENVPREVSLVAGMTATVEIQPGSARAVAIAPGPPPGAARTAPEAAPGPSNPVQAAGANPPAPADDRLLGAPSALSAAAILPPLAANAGANVDAGPPPPAPAPAPASTGQASSEAQPLAAASRPVGGAQPDAAREEALEIQSEQAFDRALNIDEEAGPIRQGHASESLRRRGRYGFHRRRYP